MTVRMGDKDAWCDAYVPPNEAVPALARFHPKPSDTDWTTCPVTRTQLYRGFCGSLSCAKRAWQISKNGKVEHGRLCDDCLKKAAP